MPPLSVEQIIPEMRDAIGPVILISGVGLLLLTMTNRLGRTIDHARRLQRELAELTAADQPRIRAQIEIIYRRARIIRMSILLAATSALLSAVLIITLFLGALWQWNDWMLVCFTFVAGILSLGLSLIMFMLDINLSLHALKLELRTDLTKPD